ncbi:MAG: hypothetical protein KGL39_09755 [Patescibacteria group bacterium]|nr:hypothetical protein [Patescibacteria group bacterium]
MGSQYMGPAAMNTLFRNPALYRQASSIREAQYGGRRSQEMGAQDLNFAKELNSQRAKMPTMGIPAMRKR